MKIPFENTYHNLPARFFQEVALQPTAQPEILLFNYQLADELQLPAKLQQDKELQAGIFSGSLLPPGAEPIAMVYAGHQFGGFVPRLGDGRALLLGEVIDASGSRRDIALKGSGPTMFSRRGDGRSTLSSALREYLVSEAMYALGIATTRSLAVSETGQPVHRDTAVPGGVLTRVATSHIRVGTFEYFAARGDFEAVRILADYTIDRHYPQLHDSANPYLELLRCVVQRQARLAAQWMSVGFIHGVLNTDNTSISGETLDYGPCAFLDEYNIHKAFSSIDIQGRYAYGRQAPILLWNMEIFAECLLPLINSDQEQATADARSILQGFSDTYNREFMQRMSAKIGFPAAHSEDVQQLVIDLLQFMQDTKLDFTRTFRLLDVSLIQGSPKPMLLSQSQEALFRQWFARWQAAIPDIQQASLIMQRNNPACIARNHILERALENAEQHGDMSLYTQLLTAVQQPFTEPALGLNDPPAEHERITATFCGT